MTEPNKFGKSLQEWWDSDACKQLQKEHQESIQRAVGKYHMLSSEDKYDMVQALCYIICKAEKQRVSHRGLMDELGIYPEAFWISDLMTIHNALYEYYDKRKQKQELEKDIENVKEFLDNNSNK